MVVNIQEMIIHKQLFRYLNINVILYKNQNGFKTSYSCLTNLLIAQVLHSSRQSQPKKNSVFQRSKKMTTKLITGISKLLCDKRLAKLNLFLLSYWGTKDNLVTVFRFLSNNFSSKMHSFFLSFKTEFMRTLQICS